MNWISVNGGLPETNRTVLAKDENGEIGFYRLVEETELEVVWCPVGNDGSVQDEPVYRYGVVKYWMNIPETLRGPIPGGADLPTDLGLTPNVSSFKIYKKNYFEKTIGILGVNVVIGISIHDPDAVEITGEIEGLGITATERSNWAYLKNDFEYFQMNLKKTIIDAKKSILPSDDIEVKKVTLGYTLDKLGFK